MTDQVIPLLLKIFQRVDKEGKLPYHFMKQQLLKITPENHGTVEENDMTYILKKRKFSERNIVFVFLFSIILFLCFFPFY